ncbi:IS21 family transposase, partial [Bifidobacterium longum]
MAMPMPKQQDIRRLDRQGVSRSEIARRLDVDRATVAKYADMDDMTPKPPMDRRRGSKIDPYAALVDEWLEADRMLPRKQRHTAKRVHDRLRAETGYDGEYTTTPGYVRRWREANRSGSDGYGELVWAPGVAQIDFGVAKARIAGGLVDDHCLVVTFPHSNMRYVTSLPGENAECLCHGLVEVFGHIGGVPPVIVMDNATGAGRGNARGEVTPAAVFDAFLAHHRIDARFRNPYSGWEKGAVENAVGFLRRNLMVPPPEAETHARLGRITLDRCDALAASSRHHRRGTAIGDVFGEDRAALMPLPSTTFDPIRWESRRADKYGQIDIDSNRYLAGAALHGRTLLAAIR